MAKRLLHYPLQRNVAHCQFRKASFDLLADFLTNLNEGNKYHLNSLSKCTGSFKQKRLVDSKMSFNFGDAMDSVPSDGTSEQFHPLASSERPRITLTPEEFFKCLYFTAFISIHEYIFMVSQELRLDPLVGYHAVELLERFMVKHLSDLLNTRTPQGATGDDPRSYENAIFDKLKDKFLLILFSCVQLANKMSLHCHMIDSNTAVHFLNSMGLSVSKQAVLESELMVLKGLEFRLNVPNPLTYVETLLEVLGNNEPSIPVEHLYHLCHHVLQFITLQKTAIYDTLLRVTTHCVSPSREQREKFVTVKEDSMLLGVGVIAVATFIHYVRKWEQVIGELTHISGISKKSISDIAHATLVHIVNTSFPAEELQF